NPLGTPAPFEVKGAQTVRNCQLAEEPSGVLINAVSKEPFTYKDACVERNPHVGYDVAATVAVRGEVGAFLTTLFKLY
ncbi:MAG: carboxymethylenebutenolidase, partial [Burkholderiales bacterium]